MVRLSNLLICDDISERLMEHCYVATIHKQALSQPAERALYGGVEGKGNLEQEMEIQQGARLPTRDGIKYD